MIKKSRKWLLALAAAKEISLNATVAVAFKLLATVWSYITNEISSSSNLASLPVKDLLRPLDNLDRKRHR